MKQNFYTLMLRSLLKIKNLQNQLTLEVYNFGSNYKFETILNEPISQLAF